MIVVKRRAKPDKVMPEWEEISAVAMAVQNVHLLATAMGIGMFWSSHTFAKDARDSDDFKEYLDFKGEDLVLGGMVFGRYDQKREFKSSRGPMKDKVQYREE